MVYTLMRTLVIGVLGVLSLGSLSAQAAEGNRPRKKLGRSICQVNLQQVGQAGPLKALVVANYTSCQCYTEGEWSLVTPTEPGYGLLLADGAVEQHYIALRFLSGEPGGTYTVRVRRCGTTVETLVYIDPPWVDPSADPSQ